MRSNANRTLEQGAVVEIVGEEKTAGKGAGATEEKSWEHLKTIWRFYRQFMWQ